MEPSGAVLHAAGTAPLASGPRQRAYGSSAPQANRAGEADGQSSEVYLSPSAAILQLVLAAVEQYRAVSEFGQGAEQAATTPGFDIGREYASGTGVERSLDLYA